MSQIQHLNMLSTPSAKLSMLKKGDTPMNLWTLNKDIRIKECLILLEQYFASESYRIACEIPFDARAIYLIHRDEPDMRAYIFTLAQSSRHFGIQLEFPENQNGFKTMETYEELSIHALAEILSVHLDLIYKPQ